MTYSGGQTYKSISAPSIEHKLSKAWETNAKQRESDREEHAVVAPLSMRTSSDQWWTVKMRSIKAVQIAAARSEDWWLGRRQEQLC